MGYRYSLAVRTTNVTTGNATVEMIAGATQGFRLLELGISLGVSTLSTYGLGVPAAKGITPTSPVTMLTEGSVSGSGAANAPTTALAWGTGPTVPAAFFRRFTITGGFSQFMWTPGLVVPANTTLVLWNLSTTQVADVYMVVEY